MNKVRRKKVRYWWLYELYWDTVAVNSLDEKLQERIQTERKYLQKWCEPWTKLDGKRYGTDDCMNFTEILLLWTLEQKWFYINDENLQK